MNKYILFWLDGKKTEVKGDTAHQAMNNSGYSRGSVRALDFYCPKDKADDYYWNKEEKSWRSNKMDIYCKKAIKGGTLCIS